MTADAGIDRMENGAFEEVRFDRRNIVRRSSGICDYNFDRTFVTAGEKVSLIRKVPPVSEWIAS
jgi:hypothetical protein